MSNASKLITVIIILFLLGLFLPYLGINIFTESPYSEKAVSTRRNIPSSEFVIPTNTFTNKNKKIDNSKVENSGNRQKTINQQNSFDDIFADIDKD